MIIDNLILIIMLIVTTILSSSSSNINTCSSSGGLRFQGSVFPAWVFRILTPFVEVDLDIKEPNMFRGLEGREV